MRRRIKIHSHGMAFSLLAAIRWRISQLFILITAQPPTAHHFLFFSFLFAPLPPHLSQRESFLGLPLQPSASWASFASNAGRGINLSAVIKTAGFVAPLPSSSSRPWWHNGVRSVWNGLARGKKNKVCHTILCRVGKKKKRGCDATYGGHQQNYKFRYKCARKPS